ncbi:ABC transporter substrate-binding protein [Azospirillum soli]|uniref:ABC transporter substrate-binding protein n=1 Tax=Azospirillum soli TaxID=1304799 RepID=UPI001AE64EE6|nr:ABC transporter substrate-binding protein [Azospirillum soli]MBP2312265.1 putative thiamine transport system substrate-binding protein [Azospirillum soli]
MRLVSRLLIALVLLAAGPAAAQSWAEISGKARGQTVYFNAWGGSTKANDYIAWVGEQVKARHGIELRHVKVTDIAETVARVLAEKTAGRMEGGSADLLWINGENFAAMKANGLLHGPFTQALPNMALVDTAGKPTTVDFTVPVDGYEAPWSMAQLVFVRDTAVLPDPPTSIPALLDWAKANPGRFTYPQPPNFLGTTFLKQALIALTDDPAALTKPVESAAFERVTARLWPYLDALHPLLWRQGRVFPANGPDQRRLLNDGEIDISLAFSALEAASAIESGLLPATARVYTLNNGTIGNANFVAIPFNARAKEAAMVVADFLLSPEAQARKLDPRHWGTGTVLDLDKLSADQRALFDAVPKHPAAPALDSLGPALPEPHPSWMERIEKEWARRYAAG